MSANARTIIVTQNINEGKPEVAIIIPVADRQDEITTRCLDHLMKVTTVPARIYLVESSGTDFSYGRAMNEGIKAAKDFDIVIGMDSDAFPRYGAVERLLGYMRLHPQVGLSGVRVTSSKIECNIGWAIQSMPRFVMNCVWDHAPLFALRRILLGNWWSFGVQIPKAYLPGKMVGVVTTMFALRRQCYNDVGPWSEAFRVSFVDVDYNFRILLSDDWYVSSCSSAEVFHEEHTTRMAKGDKMALEGWTLFLELWEKKDMEDVKRAAACGKFFIPAYARYWG